MKLFKILMVMGVLAFGTTANANLLTIDFAGGYGGTLTGDQNAVAGSSINIDSIIVQDDTGTNTYDVQGGQLFFDTDATSPSMVITGAVSALSISDGTLFSGNIINWTFTDTPVTDMFFGDGIGTISGSVMDAVVSDDVNPFSFVGFSLESSNGDVLSTDFLMTATETRTPEVPVPAAVWLFGSGLLGLVGVARRKTMA